MEILVQLAVPVSLDSQGQLVLKVVVDCQVQQVIKAELVQQVQQVMSALEDSMDHLGPQVIKV